MARQYIALSPSICPHCFKKPNCRSMMLPCDVVDQMRPKEEEE